MAFASGSPAVLLHRDRQFFARMTIGLALVIVLGFGQFAALGRVDYRHVPLWFHVHGALMLSWLTLAVVQTQLAARACRGPRWRCIGGWGGWRWSISWPFRWWGA